MKIIHTVFILLALAENVFADAQLTSWLTVNIGQSARVYKTTSGRAWQFIRRLREPSR